MSAPDPKSTVQIEAGSVVVLRLYDVAYSIDLARVDELVRDDATAGAHRRRLSRTEPKAVSFDVPPLQFTLGRVEIELGEERANAEALTRIYDFGVITLALRVPLRGLGWGDFTSRTNAIGHWASSPKAAPTWEALRDRVRRLIRPAMVRPAVVGLEEDYLLSIVNRLDREMTAGELMETVDVATVLSGEERTLSPAARRDLMRHAYSYFEDDLAVLTWDRAFLYEPSGDTDVADVVEVANAQLLELRYFDDILNAELPRINDRVEAARSHLRAFSRTRYNKIATDLHTLVADVTEIREKVDNALQVTEDVYLARIYNAALDLFRVKPRAAGVDRKLGIIRDTYMTLFGEAAAVRTEILELTIVLLIVLEILLTFVGH